MIRVNQLCQHGDVDRPDPYYRRDLALVHHRGFAFHAAGCAPGILERLTPVRAHGGVVIEIGCGTGLLTKELIAAGHRVIATDASPAMLDVAREVIGDGAEEIRQLVLPNDPLPPADAIVGVGHPINYLPDLDAIHRALFAIADALRPGGVLALDICDLEYCEAHVARPQTWEEPDPTGRSSSSSRCPLPTASFGT